MDDNNLNHGDKQVDSNFRPVVAGVLMYMLAPLGMTLIPLLVGAAATDLGFSDTQVGFLASADLLGLAVASVSAAFWIHKISWRTVGLVSIIILIVGNIFSSLAKSFEILCLARFVTELGSGGIFSLALVSLGALKKPDRYFAIGIGATIALSVGIFLWIPGVIAKTGIGTVFLVHGLMSALVLPAVAWLNQGQNSSDKHQKRDSNASYRGLFVCFAAFSCFTIAEGGVWSYVERIGDAADLTPAYVGKVLATTQFASLAAAIIASVLSTKIGRTLPICFGIGIFILGFFLLLQPDADLYMIAACLTQFAWIFVLPFLLLMCVELDPSARYYVLTTAFKMGGFSAGPAIVALFLGSNGYALVSWIGIGFLLLCLVLIIPLSLKLDRSRAAKTA